MSRRFKLAIVTLAVVLMAAQSRQRKETDQELIQGEWRAVSGEIDGKSVPRDRLDDIAVLFDGEDFEWKPGSGALQQAVVRQLALAPPPPSTPTLKFRLAPEKTPKELDIEVISPAGGRRWDAPENIYSLDNDKLTICWSTKKRPDGFNTTVGDGRWLLTFRRVSVRPDRRGPDGAVVADEIRKVLPKGWTCRLIDDKFLMGHPHGLGLPRFRLDFLNREVTFREDGRDFCPNFRLHFHPISEREAVLKAIRAELLYSWDTPSLFAETDDYVIVTSSAWRNCRYGVAGGSGEPEKLLVALEEELRRYFKEVNEAQQRKRIDAK